MKIDRLFEIILILLHRGSITAPELAQHFEISTRTIYRDIDTLSGAGVPIYCKQGAGGGVTLLPGYVLPKAMVSDRERDSILLSLKTLQITQFPQVESLLEKLGGLFQRAPSDWIKLDFSPWNASPSERDRLAHIQNALIDSRELIFDYLDAQGRKTRRRIQPIQLTYKMHCWYLSGWCLLRQDARLFRISRMRQVALTDTRFDREEVQARMPGIEEEWEAAPLVHLTLRFQPQVLSRLYDEYDESRITREDEGTYRVEVDFPLTDWVYGHLLSFGPEVEVMEPACIREALAEQLRRTLNQYEKTPRTGEHDRQMTSSKAYTQGTTQFEGGKKMELQDFCQSCGMPLEQGAQAGTEADGSASPDYCKYCYQQGRFSQDCTMQDMIDFCAPIMVEHGVYSDVDTAKQQMQPFFAQLKRWKEEQVQQG